MEVALDGCTRNTLERTLILTNIYRKFICRGLKRREEHQEWKKERSQIKLLPTVLQYQSCIGSKVSGQFIVDFEGHFSNFHCIMTFERALLKPNSPQVPILY